MPKYKNISRSSLSLIHKGRKILIKPGQIIEGPDSFNMYKDLKKVDQSETIRYEKAVSKVMRYNPKEAKRLNLNVETFTKVNNIEDFQPLKFNIEAAKDVINYVENFNKNEKPYVAVLINGNSIEYNKQIDISKKYIEYNNVRFFMKEDEIESNKYDFVISHDCGLTPDCDYVNEIVKFGILNTVSLPFPFELENLEKNAIRNTIKENYVNKSKVFMTIGTLSHNIKQYKDLLNDLTKQKTNLKIEILVAPNYSNVYKSCSEALNILKFVSNGEVINLCHQDLRLQPFWVQQITNHIKNLDSTKTKWGVLGMAGSHLSTSPSNEYNVLYLGDGKTGKSFSTAFRRMYGSRKEVQCIDELSLIIKRKEDIWFDEENFDHYHFYGSDICLQYLSKGYKNYAIDAECIHLSDGQTNLDKHKNQYIESSVKLYKKWKDVFKCWKTTTANFRPDQRLIVPLIFVLINLKRGNRELPSIINFDK